MTQCKHNWFRGDGSVNLWVAGQGTIVLAECTLCGHKMRPDQIREEWESITPQVKGMRPKRPKRVAKPRAPTPNDRPPPRKGPNPECVLCGGTGWQRDEHYDRHWAMRCRCVVA